MLLSLAQWLQTLSPEFGFFRDMCPLTTFCIFIAADLLECSLSTGKMRSSYTCASCPAWQCAADMRPPLL
jgi:hypothetical protein